MNRKHIFVIGLVILIVILGTIKMCKNIKFEHFANIVVSKEPTETKIVKFTQPKQSDVLNVTTSDGQQHNGAIAYKINGSVPQYQKFPISTEQCSNTYATTSKQQFITPYLYPGKLSFTSDKINSNVYLASDSKQSWSIVVADNTTNACPVYITSNTKDIALNPPYYLEVEPPKNAAWTKKITTITVDKPSAVKNNISGAPGDYQGRILPSVKVTTIKNDINSLWIIEKIDGIKFLQYDFANLLDGAFKFLELELGVAQDERKQFIQTMTNRLKPIVQNSTSITSFINQLNTVIPNDAALSTFGIKETDNGKDAHTIIVNMLSNKLNKLDHLYQIKSVPFNLYLCANKFGGGIHRGSIILSDSKNSPDTFWNISPTDGGNNTPIVEGFDVAKFVKGVSAKTTVYNPVLVANSYPTIPNSNSTAGGWDPGYVAAWNGNYIYRDTSPSNPKEFIKVDLNNKTGIKGGRGTVTVGSKVYNVKHITKDELIAENGGSGGYTLRAKLVAGTSVNKGRPVMIFLINGENVCGTDSENQKSYCSKIENDQLNNYQDQYQAAGIRSIDMNNGLGIPKIELNKKNPNPCTNQNNNPVTKECAENLYYGEQYAPGSDEREEKGCTNKSFFENTLWPEFQSRQSDLAYAEQKIAQIQKRAKADDPNYLSYCKGDTLGKYDNKFVRNQTGSKVYYITGSMAYEIPHPGACYPGDHDISNKDIVVLTDAQLKDINEFKNKDPATPKSKNPNVAAVCIAKSNNGKSISVEGSDITFVIYNGKKYWLPVYGECGPNSESDKVIKFSKAVVSAIPPTGLNYRSMDQATISSKDPNMATFCKNADYNTPCPMNTPYVYNPNDKKRTGCCSVSPSTSINTSYPPGTFDNCPSGNNSTCSNPPCSTNPDYTGEESDVWGVNTANTVWNKEQGNTNWGWKHVKGNLKWTDGTGRDYVWGTNVEDNIYACKKPCNKGDWKQVGGELKQLSIDTQNNIIYGVNKVNNIYWQPENTTDYKWRQIQGSLTNINASGINWVWGVNQLKNSVWAARKGIDVQTGKWQQVPWKFNSKLIMISGDNQGNEENSNVYALSDTGYIFKHNINPSKGEWIMISDGPPGNSKSPNTFIEANNRVWLYAIYKKSIVYRALKSDPPMGMRWKQIKGWYSHVSVSNSVPIKHHS